MVREHHVTVLSDQSCKCIVHGRYLNSIHSTHSSACFSRAFSRTVEENFSHAATDIF